MGSSVSAAASVASLLTGGAAREGSRQRVETAADGPCWPLLAVESARYLAGSDGAVVRHLSGGVKHVLLADGGVSWWVPKGWPLPGRYAALFDAAELHDGKVRPVHCPLSTVRCPLSTVRCLLSLFIVHCPLSTARCPLPAWLTLGGLGQG